LQGGYLSRATTHFAAVDADPNADQSMKDMNKALLASANGEWKFASETLGKLLETDPDNYVVSSMSSNHFLRLFLQAVNNLSVALLSEGKLKEGIEALEKALKTSPSSVVVAEPFLFNLCESLQIK
jgi:trafficking protein particle complex subunit 12